VDLALEEGLSHVQHFAWRQGSGKALSESDASRVRPRQGGREEEKGERKRMGEITVQRVGDAANGDVGKESECSKRCT
jgi:hypothetical protein